MRNVKLVLEYDGTDFVGWQSQLNGRSVQQELTRVLENVLQQRVSIVGAGRTDSGVHARGQVANFRTTSDLPCARIHAALNGLLPEDVGVHSVEDVPESFHSRFDARERRYCYYISRTLRVIGRRYCWHLKCELDIAAMQRLAREITGGHDFEAFCKHGSGVMNYLCRVASAGWTENDGQLILEIRADRFLRGMVRALVGTMVEVGRGSRTEENFVQVMASRDRRQAGMAAPAMGLVLEEVVY